MSCLRVFLLMLVTLMAVLMSAACVGCTSYTEITLDSDLAIYTRGVVAADHALGSQAGLRMLQKGGNAFDAAVATSFCQAVVRPYSCGLGGGGFMLYHLNADQLQNNLDYALDVESQAAGVIVYREVAPSTVGSDYYVNITDVDNASRFGHHAVAVPGTVAGLLFALQTYGTLDRKTILEPAIKAAEDGFPIDAHYLNAALRTIKRFENDPALKERFPQESYEYLWHTFLCDGTPELGDIIRQPALANTLQLISSQGEAVFYHGEIADAITAVCPQINIDDLKQYKVEQTTPLTSIAFGRTFVTMPPPSSGGLAMQQILGILERHWDIISPASPTDKRYTHILVEAMKHAFADRAEWLADTRFTHVPIKTLTSETYIDDLSRRIDETQTYEPVNYGSHAQISNDSGTSHISVIDQYGNAVACTETINLEFGSLLVIPKYGIILNNEMDDFLTIPGKPNAFGLTQSDRNLPCPGKRPLSSMSPTIVLGSDGAVEAVAGASGGPRIITSTLQVLLNAILFKMDAVDAVAQPRLHHQWLPNAIYFEKMWTDEIAEQHLRDLGHQIRRRADIGNVQLIMRTTQNDDKSKDIGYTAACDPRKGGSPAGW